MFNSTSFEPEITEETPVVAIVFVSALAICCMCGCKYIPKWSSGKPILPV